MLDTPQTQKGTVSRTRAPGGVPAWKTVGYPQGKQNGTFSRFQCVMPGDLVHVDVVDTPNTRKNSGWRTRTMQKGTGWRTWGSSGVEDSRLGASATLCANATPPTGSAPSFTARCIAQRSESASLPATHRMSACEMKGGGPVARRGGVRGGGGASPISSGPGRPPHLVSTAVISRSRACVCRGGECAGWLRRHELKKVVRMLPVRKPNTSTSEQSANPTDAEPRT